MDHFIQDYGFSGGKGDGRRGRLLNWRGGRFESRGYLFNLLRHDFSCHGCVRGRAFYSLCCLSLGATLSAIAAASATPAPATALFLLFGNGSGRG